MTEHVKITHANRVTTITMCRADKKNAITQEMYAVMADTINNYSESDESRALIITGVEDVFTSGNDLADFSTGGADGELPPVARFLTAIKDCKKPLVASVNGMAIGVGLTMLLHCDLVYAAQSATLSAPFVGLGLVPEAASSLLLPAAVGMAVANDILLAGRKLSADEAHQYGLVARVFPDDQLQAAVDEIALQVASAAPYAMKRSKALIRNQHDLVTAHMAKEGQIFVEQLQSPDFAESIAAKMEKRAPVYA